MSVELIFYFDYKSPYAYLAQEPLDRAEAEHQIVIDWRPYTLDIPKYLGSAEVDSDGNVLSESRNDHQWRRVRYAYMDCRREANRRGITLLGPRKIMDSSVSQIGFLYAKSHHVERAYHAQVYERFWRRELDIENVDAIADILAGLGLDAETFREFESGDGRREYRDIIADAESRGVFGVPSYLVGDELFWGQERMKRAVEAVLRRRQSS